MCQTSSYKLVGSDLIRIPPEQSSALEATVNEVKSRSCTSLLTYPGMLSFYVWTGLPAPPGLTLVDANNWQLPQFRAQVRRVLQHAHNTCLITNTLDRTFWQKLVNTPRWAKLDDFLAVDFTKWIGTGDGYVVAQSTH